MKKYNVFELSVVKVNRGNNTYQYFICKQNIITKSYVEMFTKTSIEVIDPFDVEPLSNYYSTLAICNYKTGKPLMLSKKELFKKYNEINYIKLFLESDDETIKQELSSRGIFENSKVYKNSK